MRWTSVILASSSLALASCGGANQELLASGGDRDFRSMSRISEEYGTGESDAVVPVMAGEQQQTFKIWIHKSKPKIMVQTAALGATATAGFIRGLTAGIVRPEPDFQPFQQAAIDYLGSSHGPACNLLNSRKLNSIGWEWDFECPLPAPEPKSRRQ